MCNWAREPDRRQDNVTQVPQSTDRVRQSSTRPKVAVAVAAALVALGATAAMLLPPSTPAVSHEQAAAPVGASIAAVADRSGNVIEQTSTTMDDGVPSAGTDVATVRSSGHCDHGL